jgi:hypothetical protein
VVDVLGRIDQFPDFNPGEHYALTIADTELTNRTERSSRDTRRRNPSGSLTHHESIRSSSSRGSAPRGEHAWMARSSEVIFVTLTAE